jgi:plasmid replication initiation protein
MATGSIFGSWLTPIASFVALGVIAAAVALHILGRPDQFIDNLAFAAFGLIFGIAPSAQAVQAAHAANIRLDRAGLPPANGSSGAGTHG